MQNYSKDTKLNLLCAYPYFNDGNIKLLSEFDRQSYRLIVDSGAFTAWNTGKVIKFEDYCRFLERIKFLRPDACVQLDVVFNPQATHENFLKHRDLGHDVCPVFTRGDAWDYMEQLLDQDEYIFVGGVQKGDGAKEFAKFCLERTRHKKVHYLAFIRSDWLTHYKPFSVDSSTWSSSAQFGLLKLYTGDGKITNLTKQNFIKRPNEKVYSHLVSLGFDDNLIRQFGKEESWSSKKFNYFETSSTPSLHSFASICSYIKYSIEAQNIIGTKIYMAVGSDFHTRMFLFAYQWMKDKGKI